LQRYRARHRALLPTLARPDRRVAGGTSIETPPIAGSRRGEACMARIPVIQPVTCRGPYLNKMK